MNSAAEAISAAHFFLRDVGFKEKRDPPDRTEQLLTVGITFGTLQFLPDSEEIPEHQSLTPLPNISGIDLYGTAGTFKKILRNSKCCDMAQVPESLCIKVSVQMVMKLKRQTGFGKQECFSVFVLVCF